MRSLLQKLFFLVVPAIILLSQKVFAMAQIMPLDEVRSGMSGVGYTVIDYRGVIEPFDVDIVGVTGGSGKGVTSLIMARASGALMERTGGVLQGMSGSPIYVDGKLIGALAIGYKETSPYTFFITPIENMLKIWDMPDNRAFERPAVFVNRKTPVENQTSAESPTSDENINSTENNSTENNSVEVTTSTETDDGLNDLGEEKTAIFFNGFDNNGLDFLKRELEPLGFKDFYAAPAAGSRTIINHNATLVPGAPFGVAVICGDFTLGATGTVTAVDNERIIGFGHSFAHAGNVNYFMTDATVIGPLQGTTSGGMRITSTGDIIGRINQDRDAGVSGILGKFPNVVPITVRVKNNSLNTIDTYNASIAYNENLLPKLGVTVAYSALSKSMDSLSEATVTVKSGSISRQNMFYNDTDVGQVAIIELLQALNLVCGNVTNESDIFNIEVNMEVDQERKSASLVSAVPDKKDVKPGQTVNFAVTLQPYRKPTETINIPYTIPLATREGTLTLDIHGGAIIPTAQATPTGIITPSTESPAKEYERRIKNFINAGRTNQIVVEPTLTPAPKTEKELKQALESAKKAQERVLKSGRKNSAPQTQKFDADYIIDNVIQVSVNVGKL